MKKLNLILVALLLSVKLFAQGPPVPTVITVPQSAPRKPKVSLPPPLAVREVSGIVIDSTEETIIGATVTMIAQKDTMRTVANKHGVFVFHNVKSSSFSLIVKGMSFTPFTRNYKYSDLQKYVVLDPIILKTSYRTLKVVQIQGVIGVVYKTDTAEYTATDYKVRENATVDELLKKMPGVEVSNSGKVTYQGQDVTKAKVNGKTFAGGNVAQVIQNLPANIVEKAQFVNDYGEQAERTGNKDGDPNVTLNITTRADKSIGNIARITAGGGDDSRYDERLTLTRLNANQQISFIGNLQNSLNGVAPTSNNSSGAVGGGVYFGNDGSGGHTQYSRSSVSYRDQFGKHVQFNGSYSYNFINTSVLSNSNGQYFSSNGTTGFTNASDRESDSHGHNFNFELDITPDSADFIRIAPNFIYSGSSSGGNSKQNLSGFQNEDQTGFSGSTSTTPSFGGIFAYQRIFKKKGRNFYIQTNLNSNNYDQSNESNKHIIYYKDTLRVLLRDSLQHFIVSRSNLTRNYATNMSYAEPLTSFSRLNFLANYNYRSYDNSAVTDSISKTGTVYAAPSFSNIFKYSFSELRIGMNYMVSKVKYGFSVGFTAIPSALEGSKISLNTTVNKTYFHLIPVARFNYNWSKTQIITINYSGSNNEPTFTQIQPVTDKSDPQNVIVGNPDLRPSFRNTISLQYRNYLANAKLSLGAGGSVSIVNDQIINNSIQVPIPNLNSFYYETHFLNIDGAYNVNGNYSITKQFNSQKYTIALNGSISNNKSLSMSNSILYPSTTWRFSQRLGPQINPNEFIEINPNIGLEINRSFFTQPNARNSDTKNETISLDGRFFIGKTWRIGYSASKNYIQGLSYNTTKNPFVINGYLEKEFFAKKNGILRLQVFDLLNQNNFVNQSVTESSITNSNTNVQSRYLFLSFVLNLQKWSGTPKKNGVIMQRRGDGSFIY